ncbi:hypothetical protein K438DRAFT_1866626 [Mycena galopus ATCC 62051]|nr:hypothetical protein K438DRAFT_1866626 [Mycena galopus ATCC 62051]
MPSSNTSPPKSLNSQATPLMTTSTILCPVASNSPSRTRNSSARAHRPSLLPTRHEREKGSSRRAVILY